MVIYCNVHNRIQTPDGKFIWLQQVVKLGIGQRLQDLGVQVTFAPCDFCYEQQGRLFNGGDDNG